MRFETTLGDKVEVCEYGTLGRLRSAKRSEWLLALLRSDAEGVVCVRVEGSHVRVAEWGIPHLRPARMNLAPSTEDVARIVGDVCYPFTGDNVTEEIVGLVRAALDVYGKDKE